MIEKVLEFTGDLGIDIVKSSLQTIHNSRKIRNDIIDFAEHRYQQLLICESYYNEIDYQGYLKYVKQDMLDEIKRYICTVNYKDAEDLKRTILYKASSYEKKVCCRDGCILLITENCIDIVKEYYTGKLDGNNQLLAHITVQTILGTIIPKLDTMQKNINQIKNILIEQDNRSDESSFLYEKAIADERMFSDNEKESANNIWLIYCKEDMVYTEELKKYFTDNSITFNECCYIDEYSENRDAVSYLGKNNILILFIGEAFLQNIHCTYGLAEATKRESAEKYIFPLIIDRSIFSERNRIERIAYWESKENELRISVEELDKVQHAHKLVSENLLKYERTAQSIDEFVVWILNHSYSESEIEEIIKKKVLPS